MTIITTAPTRLAIYGFYSDNGGVPAAVEVFKALLAAHYHPSLTSTTSVNGIYSLTLVELPSNELDTFRTQQIADERSWGKPPSYFEFAKLNPRVPVEITADDYAYMLGVLPPIHRKHCFGMGDLYTHNPAGKPIYYWACKRDRRYFCLLGTQEEAEHEFAPTPPAHTTLVQKPQDKRVKGQDSDAACNSTSKKCSGDCQEVKPHSGFYTVFGTGYPDNLSRLCKSCNSIDGQRRQHRRQLKRIGREAFAARIAQHRTLADAMQKILNESRVIPPPSGQTPSLAAPPIQVGQLCPPILWTKPLTACGPEEDPNVKLHGTVNIHGVSFHAEAFEVSYSTDGEQIGKQDEAETHLGEICNIVQGAADSVVIAGREYVLAIIPAQR
jgi:hypothetical protein